MHLLRSRLPRLLLLAAAPALAGCQIAENLAVSMFRSPERSGRLVDGKQEGRWVYRFESGATKAEGEYEDDKQIGHWIYWYENGNVEWEGEFDDQRLAGPSLFGYENGNRQAVGVFVDGLEEDLWTFWREDGSLDQEGDYAAGKPTLRWTYFHPDGAVKAEGYRRDGQRIGPWQFFTAAGDFSERRFPVPDGVGIVQETWDGSMPRREGFLVEGVQQGRWVTWHPNGRRRTTGDFVDGVPSGLWLAWAPSGEPVARGRMVEGNPIGHWRLWSSGREEVVPAAGLSFEAELTGEWSRPGGSVGDPRSAFAEWLAEAASPVTAPLDLAPDPNVPSPPPELVAVTETTPPIRFRPQPWTLRESESLDYLVARYSDGGQSVAPPRRSGYARRRGGEGAVEKETGDPVLSPRFLGTQLPWTRFFRADGGVVDLDDYRGKRKVVLVVLRGFAREVCVYCVTQTEALCDNHEAFQAEGAEVFVVYPGELNRLEVFMESFRKVSKHMGEPPIGVLYDRNMELVNRMGISSEFAIPSTFVVDENGVIQYSYVGREVDDRPPAQDVLDAIRGMSGR